MQPPGVVCVKTEPGHGQKRAGAAQDPYDYVFAVDGGDDRKAHLVDIVHQGEGERAVLREPLLGYVEAGEYLEPRYDAAVHRPRKAVYVLKDAVYPEEDMQCLGLRGYVYVGGVAPDAVHDEQLGQGGYHGSGHSGALHDIRRKARDPGGYRVLQEEVRLLEHLVEGLRVDHEYNRGLSAQLRGGVYGA